MKQKIGRNYFEKNEVAGVVVLYNPSKTVLESINSYLDQVEHLFIIDNSAQENHFLNNELNGNVSYLFNNSNIGIAAALNKGARKAIEQGFRFLLTMDQDSRAPIGMVKSLLQVLKNHERIGIVSPLHSNRYGTHLNNANDIEKVNVVMTSGNLISLEAYLDLEGFREEFFIDYVDIEYCFRLHLNNYYIFRLNKVILEHEEANLTSVKIFNKIFYPHNHEAFRLYYKTRNLLYLRKIYHKSLSEFMKIEYDSYLRTVVKVILFEKHKLRKIRMVFLGIFDFTRGKKGQRIFS